MKAVRSILAALLALPLLLTAGCKKEDDNTLPNQERRILSFLTGTLHLRTEEEAADPSADVENPPFYTVVGDNTYRWITNYYDADRSRRTEVVKGSTVSLTISVYYLEFRQINKTSTVPLYTNNEELLPVLEKAGLNPAYWSFEPYVIKIGSSAAISALAKSLVGCREGDIVEVYTAYPMGYDDKWLYAVEPQSPLALHFTIDKVE